MKSLSRILLVGGLICLAVQLTAEPVAAQRGGGFGGRRFGTTSRVQLATLDSVQAELKMTDEQKQKASEIDTKLTEDRRAMFQQGGGGQGNLGERLAQMQELDQKATETLMAALEEPQQQRLHGLFVQVNGSAALADPMIQKALELTDAQKQKLEQVNDEYTASLRESFQDLQGASQEERQAKMQELRDGADKKRTEVLTEEQQAQLTKLKGDELAIDVSSLRRGFGGGRRGNNN